MIKLKFPITLLLGFAWSVYIFTCVIQLQAAMSETTSSKIKVLRLQKQVAVPQLGESFYYPNLINAKDKVILSFRAGYGKKVYAIKYDANLNQISEPINLTQGIENVGGYEEDYPDHVLIYHEGNFYAAFHSFWPPDNFGLYVVKYDENLRMQNQRFVGYYDERIDEPGREEVSDSPLIKFYNGNLYIMNGHVKGVAVRSYDSELNFKRKLVLEWENRNATGTSDLILFRNGYGLIQTEGTAKPKLSLLEFDDEGNFLKKRRLIPEEITDTFQEACPRAFLSNGQYYIAFRSSQGFSKFASQLLSIGVFDEDLNIVKVLEVNDFKDSNYPGFKIQPSEYIAKINNDIYVAFAFAKKGEEEAVKLILTKYKLK